MLSFSMIKSKKNHRMEKLYMKKNLYNTILMISILATLYIIVVVLKYRIEYVVIVEFLLLIIFYSIYQFFVIKKEYIKSREISDSINPRNGEMEYMDNCIFCKIANGLVPSETVYEDEDFRAILDIAPATKGHTLILPKGHCQDIIEMPSELKEKALKLASRIGEASVDYLSAKGFNIVINTGKEAGQTVFHCHIHIIPRYGEDEHILSWENKEMSAEELQATAKKLRVNL